MKAKYREQKHLVVLGAINWDVSIFEERFAEPGEEVPVRLVEEFSGGKGANVAVAAARVLGRDRVSFVGALGDDDVSERQLHELRKEGVLTHGTLVLKHESSGRAYIIVDRNGRKTIHTQFGANDRISPKDLRKEGPARAILEGSCVVLMDVPTAVALEVARMAKERGSLIIYSPGVRSKEGRPKLKRLLDQSDFVIVDAHELKFLGGQANEDECIAELGASFPNATFVATLGPRGSVLFKGNVRSPVRGVDLASLGKKVVNSTGSGDAFLGVFASYLMEGEEPVEAVEWGNLAGALKAARYETRGSPRRGELENCMRALRKPTTTHRRSVD